MRPAPHPTGFALTAIIPGSRALSFHATAGAVFSESARPCQSDTELAGRRARARYWAVERTQNAINALTYQYGMQMLILDDGLDFHGRTLYQPRGM
jgi:hypothetical protein